MSEPTLLLTACPLRPIHQAGDQYAADLIRGLSEELATLETTSDFLEATHLTIATARFLRIVMDRIALGRDSISPSVYQLYSRYGGGKTHSLLLLAAAAKYPDLPYWRAEAQIDPAHARVIAFDGEKHNVFSGVEMDDQDTWAKSLAGYILYHLGGPEALRSFREGDEILADPGSDTFRRLIGDQSVIIIIDELVHYINRTNQRAASDGSVSIDGVLTTISALSNAVSNSPRAILVITTPEDAHELLGETNSGTLRDAYHTDALALNSMMARVNSQLGRVIHPVAPSGEADLPAILRKRLFYSIDETSRQSVASAYATVASRNGRTGNNLRYQDFYDAYPFHPLLLSIMTGRLAANSNFQRVRGTLRLLSNILLAVRSDDNTAALVHTYHANLRIERIRNEVINRLAFSELDPAIETDIIGPTSTAAKIGNDLAEPIAITMLLGTIAPEISNGLYEDQIADALLSLEHDDFGVIANVIQQFLDRAIYVDDNLNTQRKRFSKDANVMKELLEAKEAVLADTVQMADLLRQTLRSAYSGGRRGDDQFEILIYPSRQSNVPDDSGRAVLGVINPDYWNWNDAGNSVNGMSNQDLIDLYRHSSKNNGDAPRQYPNNALLLAAHDGNLDRIRDDIATVEAAEYLLKDRSRSLPQHRRDTLENLQAAAEKNATTGIQNKFTHLFSAGNSQQHQWPSDVRSHLEHRPLESITDAAGKGQDSIMQALGDRVLRGATAALNQTVWERVAVIANEKGSTLGELREYFARTPDARIIINETTWCTVIANAVRDDLLHVETLSGEVNPTGYDTNWRVWAKGYEPQPEPIPQPDVHDTDLPTEPQPVQQNRFTSEQMSGRAAYESVKRFMSDNSHDWPKLLSCKVQGTNPSLADQIASIAQGDDIGITITLKAQNQRIQVAIQNASPSEFKDYSNPAKRMLNKAGVKTADITVQLTPIAAQRVLEKLNNRDEANITVVFR